MSANPVLQDSGPGPKRRAMMIERPTVFHDLLADAGFQLCEQIRQGMRKSLDGRGEEAASAYNRAAVLIPPIMIVRDAIKNGFDELTMQRLLLLAKRVEALAPDSTFPLIEGEKDFARSFLQGLK